jgi:hypothetical protein
MFNGWRETRSAEPSHRSAIALVVVPCHLHQPVGPRIGLAVPSRPRLRLAALKVGPKLAGKPGLLIFLWSLLLGLALVGRIQPGNLGLRAKCVHLAAQAYSRRKRRLKVHSWQERTLRNPTCIELALMERSTLALGRSIWQKAATFATCCGSSVVEHSLGKGEVESSILSRSTSLHSLKSFKALTRCWRGASSRMGASS